MDENKTEEMMVENAAENQQVYTCQKCGTAFSENSNFCPNCGTQKVDLNMPVVCKKCGATMIPGQQFCAACGNKNNNVAKKTGKKKKLIIGVVAIVAVIVLIVIFASSGSKNDLNSVYEDVVDGTSIYVDITSDGKSITVDTNPFDYDDYYSSEATGYVRAINNALGLPNSVYEKMNSTSALDGRISEDHGNVRVSWKYHPDNGLEVIYEIIE